MASGTRASLTGLVLSPSTGKYQGLTERGEFTAEVLLNRDLVERGRKAAWLDALDHIRGYGQAIEEGDVDECRQRQFRLRQDAAIAATDGCRFRWSSVQRRCGSTPSGWGSVAGC